MRVANREPSETNAIDSVEFDRAESTLIKNVQSVHFHDELQLKGQNIPKSSPLHQLNVFINEEGFLRCRTRLEKASDLTYNERFPIVLPNDDFFSEVYVRWLHGALCLHSGGVAAILQQLRSKFFVLRARKLAKAAINGCKKWCRVI